MKLDLSKREGKRGLRGARSKAGRGARGGGSGGGEMNREVAVSKALSKLLRHAATDAGLRLDPEGFARVDQVVSTPLRLKPRHGVHTFYKQGLCHVHRTAGTSIDLL